jgi:hypothetical protein
LSSRIDRPAAAITCRRTNRCDDIR